MATLTLTVPDTAIPLITEICKDDGWDGVTSSLDVAVTLIMVQLFKDKAIQLRYKQNVDSARLIGDAAALETENAFKVVAPLP